MHQYPRHSGIRSPTPTQLRLQHHELWWGDATVIDSGVTLTHDEFRDVSSSSSFAGQQQRPSRARHGHDFVNDNTVATDCDGHGTHVSGTIAGKSPCIVVDDPQ